MSALFIDDDGRFAYVVSGAEYVLGYQRPGEYVHAWRNGKSQQPCTGGGWRGNTVYWPTGAATGYEPAIDRHGCRFNIPTYDDMPTADVLKSLGRTLNARTYKSRAAFERHYKAEESLSPL